MKKRNEKFIVITLLIIGLVLLIIPLIDNVKSISDIFKKQILLNSVIEYILMFIGIIILGALIILIFYIQIKQEKSE